MADATLDQLNNPYQEELMGLNRQRALANMLLQQNMQAPQGQMVSGRYVAPNPLQYLGNMAQIASANQMASSADEEQKQIAKTLRKLGTTETQNILNTLKGTPEVSTELAGPAYQGVAPTAVMPAKAGDANAALSQALMGQSPQAQKLVPSLIEQTNPKPIPEQIKYKMAVDGGYKGTFNDFMNQMSEADKARIAIDKQRLSLENAKFNLEKSKAEVSPAEAPLRTSFLNQATPHIQISQAYRKIENAPDSAAGDMSKIFGFMKILDPGSTVREGEYASAENARGVPETVRAQYNKAQTGQRLTPAQRKEFTQAAGDLVKSQEQQFNEMAKYYSEISVRNRINPESVIYNPYKDLNLQTTPAKTPKTAANQPAITPQAIVAPAGQFDPKLLQFMTPEQQALFGVKK